jgi:putative copper resistance protein D
VAGFADVLLRGFNLAGQAIAIGGVAFALLVLWPGSPRVWRLLTLGAAGVVVSQCLLLATLAAALGSPSDWHTHALLETSFIRASLIRILAGVGLIVGALALGAPSRRRLRWAVLIGSSLVLIVAGAWTSHAAARSGHRATLMALDALHQLAAAVWVGGLVHLLVTAFSSGERPGERARAAPLLARFSAMALGAVAVLILAGVGLTLGYVDGVHGLLGTAYGVMVLTKIVLLAGLLVLGAANFFAVRRFSSAEPTSLPRVRRFVEVELGLGITVLFAAASLTSLPPAVDVVADRATLGEVTSRFTPRMPTFTSPTIDQLPVDDPNAPRTDADRAWSEYNHHVSGLFVLLMGSLAVLHVSGLRWARHWPLVLLGLAGFMLVRNDPGAWPLGPQGFWASMAEPTVLQHRAFVLLVVLFGLFEWMVRAHRLQSSRWALVFPLLCAVGGGLLLTHSHASLNLKSEFLLEVTHAPLGVLGIVIGWARWLELRLAAPEDRLPGRVWATGMTVFGVLLLFYRES